jgi:hypothetical protein
MKQNPLEKAVEQAKKNSLDKLKGDFEEVKKQPTHRIVRLVYKNCCGCGCLDVDVKRIVPYDSELKNGDRITKLEKGDTEWE